MEFQAGEAEAKAFVCPSSLLDRDSLFPYTQTHTHTRSFRCITHYIYIQDKVGASLNFVFFLPFLANVGHSFPLCVAFYFVETVFY